MQPSNTWGKGIPSAGALFLIAALFLPFYASAITIKAAESLTLSESETIDGNAYIAGSEVGILSNLPADLLLASGEALVNGDVGGDVTSIGGSVEVRGDVGGDLRLAAGTIVIGGIVNGDVFAAGGEVRILGDSIIRGPSYIVADKVVIEGEVHGPLSIRAQTVEISGLVSDSAEILADQTLTVADGARIQGTLNYRSKSAAMISQNAVVQGEILRGQYNASEHMGVPFGAIWGLFSLVWLIGYVLAAALLAWLFPVFISRVTQQSLSQSGRSLLLGLGTIVISPIIAIILIASAIGMAIGLLILSGGIAYLIIAKLLSASIAGALLAQWFVKNPTGGPLWAGLGAFSLWIIGFVPLLGFLANALLFLAAAGSLSSLLYESWFTRRKEESILTTSNE